MNRKGEVLAPVETRSMTAVGMRERVISISPESPAPKEEGGITRTEFWAMFLMVILIGYAVLNSAWPTAIAVAEASFAETERLNRVQLRGFWK